MDPGSMKNDTETEQGRNDGEQLARAIPTAYTKTFGFKMRQYMKGNIPSDYEEKYSEDTRYEETGPNARVWRTYQDESLVFDMNMVGQLRDSVDVLLAGLFSAVVTSFVAQTYQSLQVDYVQMSASLLFELVAVQRALASGSSVESVPLSPFNPDTTFIPAINDVWVNGLWFTSLALSLTTALAAVLVKQWLHHYTSLPSGTPRERSHVRQYRYAGFQRWNVPMIAGLLPVLMHVSLALFFAGLSVFLYPLRVSLSWIVGAIAALAYTVYLIAIVLPILFLQCPYRTPLSDHLYFAYNYIAYHFIARIIQTLLRFLDEKLPPSRRLLRPNAMAYNSSLKNAEQEQVKQLSNDLSVEALHWLFSVSSNPSVQSIATQAIGGLPGSSLQKVEKVFRNAEDIREVHRELLDSCLDATGMGCVKSLPVMQSKLERLLRFELFIPHARHRTFTTDKNRAYIDASDLDDVDLVASIQSNDTFQNSKFKPFSPLGPQLFFRNILHTGTTLHALTWVGLIRNANEDGSFNPIDIHSRDLYPLELCASVTPALDFKTNSSFPSSAISFEDAVRNYLLVDMTDNILKMFYEFDYHSDDIPDAEPCSRHLRVTLAFAAFVIPRLRVPYLQPDQTVYAENSNDTEITRTQNALRSAATNIFRILLIHTHSTSPSLTFGESNLIFHTVKGILSNDVVFGENTTKYPSLDPCRLFALKIYSRMIGAPLLPNAITPQYPLLPEDEPPNWPRIRELVDFIIFDYDNPNSHPSTVTPFDLACDILAYALANNIAEAFEAFIEGKCLTVFGAHPYRLRLVRVINGYVAGITRVLTVGYRIDYLHEPENLYVACSILASNDWTRDVDSVGDDILALRSVRPNDPVWASCRDRLRKLETDAVQRPKWETELTTEEVNREKRNISEAAALLEAGVVSRGKVGLRVFCILLGFSDWGDLETALSTAWIEVGPFTVPTWSWLCKV
ncbi:hypothetical protein EV421DRAFT_1449474 [Armillaria borealis]|uniref:DUF6535 domain-containing protein n=1 Tax=Armillaria borealis TaxID=47425 RepID=A0AA39MG38_9AGAR|nr:hypothetical protein EV421DRAFT_1449474 [Armillaria borealis]